MQIILLIFAHGLLMGDIVKGVGEELLLIGELGGINFFIQLPALVLFLRELGFRVFKRFDIAKLIILIFAEGFEVLNALQFVIERIIFISGGARRSGGFCLIIG